MIQKCEVVGYIGGYGPRCEAVATKRVPDAYGYPYGVCEGHFKDYLSTTRPSPLSNEFFWQKDNPGYDSDDYDEENYLDDVREWESIRDQTYPFVGE